MPVPSLISHVKVAPYAVALSLPTPILSRIALAAKAPDKELQNAFMLKPVCFYIIHSTYLIIIIYLNGIPYLI